MIDVDNDQAILDATVIAGTQCTLPGAHTPGGFPIAAEFGKEIGIDELMAWCNHVRSEFERQRKQKSKVGSEAASRKDDGGGSDSDATERRRAGASVQESLSDLEEELQARVERIDAALEEATARRDEAERTVQSLRRAQGQARAAARAAAAAAKGGGEVEDDESEGPSE